MINRRYLIIIGVLVVLAVVGSYLIINYKEMIKPENTSSEVIVLNNLDLSNCITTDENDFRIITEKISLMRRYLELNENISFSRSFNAKIKEGTSCFVFSVDDFELYEETDNNLVIIKNGQKYKTIPRRSWMYD